MIKTKEKSTLEHKVFFPELIKFYECCKRAKCPFS